MEVVYTTRMLFNNDASYVPSSVLAGSGLSILGAQHGVNKIWEALGRPDMDFSNPDVQKAIRVLKGLESPVTAHGDFVPGYAQAMTTLSQTPMTMRDETGHLVQVEPGEYVMSQKQKFADIADKAKVTLGNKRKQLYRAFRDAGLLKTPILHEMLLGAARKVRKIESSLDAAHSGLSDPNHIRASYRHYDMFKKSPYRSAYTLMTELGLPIANGDNNLIDLLARATTARNQDINTVLNKFAPVGPHGTPDTQFSDLVRKIRTGAGIDHAAEFATADDKLNDARTKLLRYFGLNADDNRNTAEYLENALRKDFAQRLVEHYETAGNKNAQKEVQDIVKQLEKSRPYRAQQLFNALSPDMRSRVGDLVQGDFKFLGDASLEARESWIKSRDLSKYHDESNIPEGLKALFNRAKGKTTGYDNVSDFFYEMLRRGGNEAASISDLRRVAMSDGLVQLANLISRRNMSKAPKSYGNILNLAKNLRALSSPKLKALGLITAGLGGAGLGGTALYNKFN